jgi:hypothetical protein
MNDQCHQPTVADGCRVDSIRTDDGSFRLLENSVPASSL